MGILKFKVAAKKEIVFGDGFIEFLRGFSQTKNTNISFSNASGQTLIANQVLFSQGVSGSDGYIQIKSTDNVTLVGSGLLNITVNHQVSTTQTNQNINFNIDNNPVKILYSYNSKPEANDIVKEILNQATYVFSSDDFELKYIDYDNDALDSVAIFGNVDGYYLAGNPYVAGYWIPINQIANGLFEYRALNQSAYYEKDNTWKAKDINGNESN